MVRPIFSVVAACTLCTFLAWGKPIHLSRVLETAWQAEASGNREEVANSAPLKRSSRRITARSSPLAVVQLSGTVFEDANYGGGPGRPLATSGTSPLAGVTVELYNSTGAFVGTTSTNSSGLYTFSVQSDDAYTVRVVSSTVPSARVGYVPGLVPVPVFVNGDVNRVGGEEPAKTDAAANTGSQPLASLRTATTTAQAIANVAVGAASVAGVDFGFNFSTIVNANLDGQGSLRQFLANANALGGEASLSQSGTRLTTAGVVQPLPAGKETSIFMVPNGGTTAAGNVRPGFRPFDGTAQGGPASGLNASGVVAISSPALPGGSSFADVVGPDLCVDGTTQTANVDNTNDVTLGTGGTVGVQDSALVQLNGPEVQLRGSRGGAGVAFRATATNATMRGLSVYGFQNNVYTYQGNQGLLLEGNVLGTSATSFTDAGAGVRTVANNLLLVESTNGVVRQNLIGFAGKAGISFAGSGSGYIVRNNEIRGNGQESLYNGDGIEINDRVGSVTVAGNLLTNNGSEGIDTFNYSDPSRGGSNTVRNNTISNNGFGGGEGQGIHFWGNNNTITLNRITGNRLNGAVMSTGGRGNVLSQNSFSANNGLGLVLWPAGTYTGSSPTRNDLNDADAGTNDLLNFPVLLSATVSGGNGNLVVAGFARPGSTVELFVAAADPSGFGEGQTYLGTFVEGGGQDANGGTGSYGPGPVNGLSQGQDNTNRFTFPIPLSSLTTAQQAALTAPGARLTATATLAGSTSEFSGNVAVSPLLTGAVYEDVNYGGGAGRSLAASGGAPLAGATVELYTNAGALAASTVTDANGRYEFSTSAGTYTVRVVSSTVRSSRPGYVAGLLPVPTFVNGNENRVGGEAPRLADAPANTGGQTLPALTTATTTAQALAAVTLSTSGASGVDFGFNFDVIVNTNDAGQGSLRQFILNSNALRNVGLAQENGLPAGIETSIFMVPGDQAVPGLRPGLASGLLNGVTVITPATDLPPVTDANTAIDGRTQTSNVGNTNAVVLGTGGTVGASSTPLSQVPGPEVGLVGSPSRRVGLDITGNGARVAGLAIYGFGNGVDDNAFANIRVGAPNALITQNVLGTSATSFTDPGAGRTNATNLYVSTGPTVVSNNLIGYAHGQGVKIESRTEPVQIENNEISFNGINFQLFNGVYTQGPAVSVTGNLLAGNWGHGADLADGSSGTLVTNNTMTGNGRGGVATAGVAITGAGNTVSNNRIFGNYGAGILVTSGASSSLLSRNAIYGNGEVVPAGGSASGQIGIDLLTPSDNPRAGTAPYVTLNDAGDTDAGGNGLLNFPVLESASVVGGNLEVRGFARAGSAVELFLAAVHPSKFGEGQTYLGTEVEGSAQDADGSTGSYGPAPVNGLGQGQDNTNRFRFSLPLSSLTASQQAALVACGAQLTATATLGGATSEFSGVVPLAPLPLAIRVTGDMPLCAGSTVRLGAGPRPGFLYTWYNGPTVVNGSGAVPDDSVFVANTAGTYTVQVTQANCAIASTTSAPVSITVLPAVLAGTVGADQTLCAGAAPAPLSSLAAASGGTGTYDYQWQASTDNATWTNVSGATGATYAPGPVSATTYFRRQAISGACEPVYTPVVALTVLPPLTAGSISADQTVCPGAPPAPLTSSASAGGGTGTYAYQWEESADNTTWTAIAGATDQTYTPDPIAVTTYFRRQVTSGTGTCARATSNVVTLTVTPSPTAGVALATPPARCAGSTLTFTPTPTNGGAAPTFRWFVNNVLATTGATFTSATLAHNDQVRVEMTPTPGFCATGTPTATVAVTLTPVIAPTLSISAASSGPACEGALLSFGVASVTGAGAAPQYQWLLNGTAAPGATGATFSSAALRNGDRLRLRLRSSETCASPAEVLSNEVTIDLRPNTAPQVAIAGSGATCAGQPVRFAISSGNLGATPGYQWQVDGTDVAGAQSATFSSATLRDGQAVTLTVRTTTACGQPTVVTSNQVRAIVTPPAEVSAGPDKEIMEGEEVVLEGTANGPFPVEWSPAQTLSFAGGNPLRPVASPKVTTVYTIKVSANGCEAEDKVTVKVGTAIQIPNAFSPNGDGINDAWEIDRIGTFADNTVTIFNRWGGKVYSTTGYGPANMWRGTINGEAAPIGTYYYVIKLGNGKTFTGPLTIVY